jgi:hypothetical protein
MDTDEITIRVNHEIADAYWRASPPDRKRMDVFLEFQLAEFLKSPESLEQVMDEMSEESQRRGLTPATLDSILHE